MIKNKKKDKAVDVQSLVNKALLDIRQGKFSEVEPILFTALKNDPDSISAKFLLGTIEYYKHNYSKAIEILEDVIHCDPDYIEARLNLGSSYCEIGKLNEAIFQYEKILNIKPDHNIALNNLGGVYRRQNRYAEAQKIFEASIKIKPDYWISHYNLGSVFSARKKYKEAEQHYRDALNIERNPNVIAALIGILKYTNPDEAYQLSLETANSSNPGIALLSAFPILMDACEWDVVSVIKKNVVKMVKEANVRHGLIQGILLPLNRLDDIDSRDVFNIHRRWGMLASQYCKPYHYENGRRNYSPQLRIGYLSPDFRHHSVGYFITNIITNHDTEHFKIFCYSNFRGTGDERTREIRQSCSSFATIYNLTDEDLARKIHDDDIDILVDLTGHTSESRIGVMRYKPAPIQITYLGYPNTTGLETVDYRITDHYSETEHGTQYTEKLLFMPESFLCFGGFPEQSINPVSPMIRKGHVTFGSFNNISKLTPKTICVWSKILKRVEKSRLVIKSGRADNVHIINNVQREFAKYDISEDRILLHGFKDNRNDHLDFYNEIDIALDTFPYSGTTTTCEALWMGVPVVTFVGNVHAQRVSYSILKNIGIEDTIAYSEEEYINIAVSLANNQAEYERLRQQIPVKIRKSILCDPCRFTIQLEQTYERAWVEKMRDLPWDQPQAYHVNMLEAERRAVINIKGDIQVCVPNNLRLMTPYILFEQEDWFEEECAFVRHLLQAGMNVIDIGANYGIYTMTAAKRVLPDGQVWAFEPASSTAAYLGESIAINKLKNITLVHAGLSDHSGTATLSLHGNAELNEVLKESQGDGDQETIQLFSLDDCMGKFDWKNVDFLKLDAEGCEIDIIDGGKEFFTTHSPLVMYEVKHASAWNFKIVEKFRSLGYDSYKLIPNLNVLVPFNPDQNIDPVLLNLFCCKTERAEMLADAGLLINRPISVHDVDAPAPGIWVDYLQQFPYVIRQLKPWLAFIEANKQTEAWLIHQQALDYYALAHKADTPVEKRYASLKCAYQLLFHLLKTNGNLANVHSFVRIATELGERPIARASLGYILEQFDHGNLIAPKEPFLSISPNYDSIDPGEDITKWCYAAILERQEILSNYSSYFHPKESLEYTERINSLGFQTPEMERRRQLARMVTILQQHPEYSPVFSDVNNLNNKFWGSADASGEVKVTHIDDSHSLGESALICTVGMPRSASTWIYNATRLILGSVPSIANKLSYGWIGDFDSINKEKYILIKAHDYQPDIMKNAKFILYSYRDIRDVLASMMRKFNKAPSIDYADYLIDMHKDWVTRSDMVIKYENILTDPGKTDVVNKIAAMFGIKDIDAEQIIKSLGRLEYSSKGDKNEAYNTKNLYHKNHITDGRHGSWEGEIDPVLINDIEKKYADWFNEYQYPLS